MVGDIRLVTRTRIVCLSMSGLLRMLRPSPSCRFGCLFRGVVSGCLWLLNDRGANIEAGYNSLSNANWNGAGVVEKSGNKIVMVNFNYRVGMWGFLASERVRADGDLNSGLLDQRMLFKWVKEHIASVCIVLLGGVICG